MEANEKGIYPKIMIPFKIEIPKSLFLELGEIMGILLDNATEAMLAGEFTAGYEIFFKETKTMIAITVKNPARIEVPLFRLKEKGFSTKNKKDRGLGLAILEEIINRKDQLSLETAIEEETFSQTVYIRKD